MNIVFIGCVQFSHATLQHVLTQNGVRVVGVITKKKSVQNADFQSLETLASEAGIPCFFDDQNSQDAMGEWLEHINPDVIYCFGWSSLLKNKILNIPALGIIGYHPAALPKNRGRHPIIWALALGLGETGSTFFFMDEGADSGDILNQRIVPIAAADDAASLYRKLTSVALEQITEFTSQLVAGTYQRIKQDHTSANYWRKRSKIDGIIDWRMSAKSIHNLVRALTRPYPGASCLYDAKEVRIWKTRIVDACDPVVNIEAGKVLEVNQSAITVKCGDGILEILEHNFSKLPCQGEYL